MKQPIIAIDGPAGAGKSTIARLFAQKLKLLYIDTGAMYRALALKVLKLGILPEETENIAALAQNTTITLVEDEERKLRILLDEEDVTEAIRTPEVSSLVSTIAAMPTVRLALVEQQRVIAQRGGVVMDGRDIGTYVLPDADIKYFLTASLEERAKRRYLELCAKGFNLDLQAVAQEMYVRDTQDENRELAPLKKAEDALLIDTTGLNIDEVLDKMMFYWGEE